VIVQMSSERAVHSIKRPMSRDARWSRSLRITVACASAAASWLVVVGAGYLIAWIF
jgi:hypothetical protein